MKRFVLIVCSVLGAALFAAPEISNLAVTSVGASSLTIDYTVSGAEASDQSRLLSVTLASGETTWTANSLSGATSCVNGAHQVCWDLAKDGITLGKADMTMTVEYAAAEPLYCVIDLSAGSSAASYTVTYLDKEPEGGFNTDEYKTTKLVLKRVEAGTFTMGDANVEDNLPHQVTLTKSFYMGLFELTQKQWNLVMGTTPWTIWWDEYGLDFGIDDTIAAYGISYDMIRGSGHGAKWPASDNVDEYSSFIGRIRSRTGVRFDLPTEAQWEYTCRAGTTTKYSYGDTANDEYMWTDGPNDWENKTYKVGLKKSNPSGFYDMHGNVAEWCLDWYVGPYLGSTYDGSTLTESVDPKGVSAGVADEEDGAVFRVLRGGCWGLEGECAMSASRMGFAPSSFEIASGFRLAGPVVAASGVSATVVVPGATNVDPVPEVELDDGVGAALEGSADGRLAKYLTGLEKYKAYRAWVDKVAGSGEANFAARQAVKDSGMAWFAYALDLSSLPTQAPTNLVISAIEASSVWDLEVSITDISIGSAAEGANLGTVFTVEGAAELKEESFSADNVTTVFSAAGDGKLKVAVTPKSAAEKFFFRVKMMP